MATKRIKVKATRDDKRVVLFERNDEHPDGEIFISGNGSVHEVAVTAAVKKALNDGHLEEASGAAAKK